MLLCYTWDLFRLLERSHAIYNHTLGRQYAGIMIFITAVLLDLCVEWAKVNMVTMVNSIPAKHQNGSIVIVSMLARWY